MVLISKRKKCLQKINRGEIRVGIGERGLGDKQHCHEITMLSLVKGKTRINAVFFYFNVCLSVMLDSLSCLFISISFLTNHYCVSVLCTSSSGLTSVSFNSLMMCWSNNHIILYSEQNLISFLVFCIVLLCL